MLTASDIKSYCPEHTVLVLISVLKAKRKSPKRNVKLLAVAHIYREICREYNLEITHRQVLAPLKILDLAGLIKIRTNKKGITSIVAIGYGENTSEVMENILSKMLSSSSTEVLPKNPCVFSNSATTCIHY
jgi:hypothetical protein